MKKIMKLLLICTFLTPQLSLAGIVILANDEWPTSNTGFSQAPSATNYVQNIASLFADGVTGNFHAYSNNFSMTGSSLANAMISAGHTWSVGTNIDFNLSTLQGFDGIFLASSSVDFNVLTQYVNSGGNIYLAGGTTSSTGLLANIWNPFLNQYGLGFNSVLIRGTTNEPISSSHVIFNNVSSLHQVGGQEVFDLDANDARNQILEFDSNGRGIYAIYDTTVVPVPAAIWLFITGALGLVLYKPR